MLEVATLEVDEHDVVSSSEDANSKRIVTVMDSLSIEPTYCDFFVFILLFMFVFGFFYPKYTIF